MRRMPEPCSRETPAGFVIGGTDLLLYTLRLQYELELQTFYWKSGWRLVWHNVAEFRDPAIILDPHETACCLVLACTHTQRSTEQGHHHRRKLNPRNTLSCNGRSMSTRSSLPAVVVAGPGSKDKADYGHLSNGGTSGRNQYVRKREVKLYCWMNLCVIHVRISKIYLFSYDQVMINHMWKSNLI